MPMVELSNAYTTGMINKFVISAWFAAAGALLELRMAEVARTVQALREQ